MSIPQQFTGNQRGSATPDWAPPALCVSFIGFSQCCVVVLISFAMPIAG